MTVYHLIFVLVALVWASLGLKLYVWDKLSIGSKSVLCGAHCFFIHPWFVAYGWIKLYGWTWNYRHWIAFFIHDLGYWGKPNMDGPEGETHAEWAANFMGRWFDRCCTGRCLKCGGVGLILSKKTSIIDDMHYTHSLTEVCPEPTKWRDLCLYHSRFYAKKAGKPFSKLCVADKLSFALTPRWLYLPMVRLTGEIHEYMKLAEQRTAHGEPKYASMQVATNNQKKWRNDVAEYMTRWVTEHKDGREDTWTPDQRKAKTTTGVY